MNIDFTQLRKFISITIISSLVSGLVFAADTHLTTSELSNLESSGGLTTGYNYWDTILNLYKKAIAPNQLQTLSYPNGSVRTSSELTTLKSLNQVVPNIFYWNSDTKNYERGSSVSTTVPIDASSTRMGTSQLNAIHSNKTAIPNVLYWNTELNKYYQGQSDHSLAELSSNKKKITLTFASSPTNVTVTPTVLKYDKNFAASWTFDDGYGSIYRNVFPLLSGGYSIIDNATLPGLYFTDGAGNDVAFSSAEAWFTRHAPDLSEMHASNEASYWMHNNEMQTLVDYGWGLVNHGLTSEAFRDVRIANGDPLIQYPTPPGPDTLNYAYEVSQGRLETKQQFGFDPTTFVAPSGDNEYRNEAYLQGYKLIAARSGTYTLWGQNYTIPQQALRVDDINTNNFNMLYRDSRSIDDAETIGDAVLETVGLMGPNDHYWMAESGHQIQSVEDSTEASVTYPMLKQYLESLETSYGKSGADNMWFAGVPEVYDYLKVRNDIIISTEQSGNTVIITLDTSNLPDDLWYEALSLKVSSDSTLTDVSYGHGDFKHYSHNISTGLINVDWDQRWKILAEKYVTQAESDPNQASVNRAQYFVDKLSNPLEKAPYQNRINAIDINTDKTFYIDFGMELNSYEMAGNWNNIVPSRLTEENMVNSDGEVSMIDIAISGYNNTTSNFAESDAILYPYPAIRDAFIVSDVAPLTITLSGLDDNKWYSFKMIGARRYGSSALTEYTINGISRVLEGKDNISNTVGILGVAPENGTITITVSTQTTTGYINVLELTQQDTSPNLPTCTDTIKNQDETDIDCGGSLCASCANGSICGVNADCVSGNCNNGICDTVNISNEHWYLDIGPSNNSTPGNWNHLSSFTNGTIVNNFVNTDGTSTSLGLTLTDGFIGSSTQGVDASDLYPSTAQQDYFYLSDVDNTAVLTFTGLNPSNQYKFYFFGSRNATGTKNANYTVSGTTVSLNAEMNISSRVEITHITPNSNGDITVTVEIGSSSTNAYLNVIEIEKITGITPSCTDGIINQDETDIDCGGALCNGCINSLSCSIDTDCKDNNCDNGTCSTLPVINNWLIDLGGGGAPSTGNWNNIIDYTTNSSLSNLIDTNGISTNIGFIITDGFQSRNDTGTGSGAYPASAQIDSFYLTDNATGDAHAEIKIMGLDIAEEYSFTFFASRNSAGTKNGDYTIGNTTVTLNAELNASNTVSIHNVVPNALGEVIIAVDTNSYFSYLGVIDILQE